MKAPMLQQFRIMLAHHARCDFATKDRLLSPLLFGITVLLLFYFALGEMSTETRNSMFIAQSFLAAFFSLQLALNRAYAAEEDDGAFRLLRTYPLNPEAWFLAKFLVVFLYSFAVVLFCHFMASFFHSNLGSQTFRWQYLAISALAVAGPSALGIMLSALTMRSSARSLIFPLLYYPLTVPVLLAAVQANIALASGEADFQKLLSSWLGLLIIFDVVYLTICVLMFSELIKAD